MTVSEGEQLSPAVTKAGPVTFGMSAWQFASATRVTFVKQLVITGAVWSATVMTARQLEVLLDVSAT